MQQYKYLHSHTPSIVMQFITWSCNVMAAINTLFIILLWKTTTAKNIVIDGWLNGLFQELPNTTFIIIKLSTITKLLSYQYAIYYYFAVENDHWEKHSNIRMA